MWLRADDEIGLKTEGATAALIANYPAHPGWTSLDVEKTDVVTEWKDLARSHTYTRTLAERAPIYMPADPELNFQPAVRFWSGTAAAQNAFLGNSLGVLNEARPPHTVIFVLNTRYHSGNNWIYPMMFGSAGMGSFNGPGYGVQRQNATGPTAQEGRGRFRTSNVEPQGTRTLFRTGATTIAGYMINSGAATAEQLKFRFNATQDNPTAGVGSVSGNVLNMTQASTLGSGYSYSRTLQGSMGEAIIFDKILNADEWRRVESYLSLKYGTTLRPALTLTTTGRFDYVLSDNTEIWMGATGAARYQKYYNNIAAVVRDDVARLNMQHSHSTDVNSILYMGIAGTKLTDDGAYLGAFENNNEAIIWGSTGLADDGAGISKREEEACGTFDYRFDRVWYVHKKTRDDRPLKMLVAARNNINLAFGSESDAEVIHNYYGNLHVGNDLVLIIAESEADMAANIYKQVIPMYYIDGKHQTSYTFTEEDTYITFGYKINASGCMANPDAAFTGTKTFDWTQWTSRTNTNPNTRLGVNLLVPGRDLGDNIEVLSTSVSYPGGTYGSGANAFAVRAYRGFPRSVNSPQRGSLEVQRRGGQVGTNSDVVIRIQYNNPVVPEFIIAGLSGDSRVREEVQITGWCEDNTTPFFPKLSYVGDQRNATYTIRGNRATVNRRVSATASNRNGQVNVEFQGGVSVVEIRYRITNRRNTSRQNIFISPITARPVMLPPPINEDGLAFTKQIREANVFTCDLAQYVFEIHNTNCDEKWVNFTDTLQSEYMYWDFSSLSLDSVNTFANASIKINEYGGTQIITIDSLLLPPSSVSTLRLAAAFTSDAPTGTYENRAVISYYRAGGLITLPSFNRETLAVVTTCFAEQIEAREPVEVEAKVLRPTYTRNGLVNATVMFTNEGTDVTDSFLEIDFNEEFTLVPGSVKITDVDGNELEGFKIILPAADDEDKNFFSIVGVCYQEFDAADNPLPLPSECTEDSPEGFTLPSGELLVTFQLKAPAEPTDEVDNNNIPTGRKVDLEINYNFSTGMDEPCLDRLVDGQGTVIVPFQMAPLQIITNRHINIRRNRKM
jgi:hypothetical protein